MEIWAILLGLLLVICGKYKIKFLIELFSYRTFLLEILGKKNFCVFCIILGIILIIAGFYVIINQFITTGTYIFGKGAP